MWTQRPMHAQHTKAAVRDHATFQGKIFVKANDPKENIGNQQYL